MLNYCQAEPFESSAAITSAGTIANWHVLYTRSRHEKLVHKQCEDRGIEAFLPLYENMSRWKDRRKLVQLPLFPGYIFLRIPPQARLQALQLQGVVSIVGFAGRPAILDAAEMDVLQKGLSNKTATRPHPYLIQGKRVRVKTGPLEGLEGIVIRRKNSLRLVVSLDLIHCAAAVELEGADLERI